MGHRNLWFRLKRKYNDVLLSYYKSKVVYSFDASWFKDKRVAIVGGADSVLREKKGGYIDSFDVVVRINKGVEVIDEQYEYVGKRTDFLFHRFHDRANDLGSSPITVELWKSKDVKHIIFSLNYKSNPYNGQNFKAFVEETKCKVPFAQIPMDIDLENYRIVDPTGPTTGFSAINTIFHCRPKEMYLTGMTFFKTPHNEAYRSMSDKDLNRIFYQDNAHSPEAEYQYVKKLYFENINIIRPDLTLQEIFETN